MFSNRVLLSPPALIERLVSPPSILNSPRALNLRASPVRGRDECEIRNIDKTPTQMDHPLMDGGAATGYVLVGFGFMGVALIAAGFTLWALKSGSVVLLRPLRCWSFSP